MGKRNKAAGVPHHAIVYIRGLSEGQPHTGVISHRSTEEIRGDSHDNAF